MTEKRVDESWKAQMRAEKERAEASKPPPRPAEEPAEPESRKPQFLHFVSMLAMQVLVGCGVRPHPMTGRRMLDLEGAQSTIEILEMLQAKTKGNLTPKEESDFRAMLSEVRLAFVKASTAGPEEEMPPV